MIRQTSYPSPSSSIIDELATAMAADGQEMTIRDSRQPTPACSPPRESRSPRSAGSNHELSPHMPHIPPSPDGTFTTHDNNHPPSGASSRVIFDEFDSRTENLRSLLFDEEIQANGPTTTEPTTFSPTSARMLFPDTQANSSFNLPPRTAFAIPSSVSPSLGLGSLVASDSLQLPSIDTIVNDPQLLPSEILARSHGSQQMRSVTNSQANSAILSDPLVLPPTSALLLSSSAEAAISLARPPPPLPASNPVSSQVSRRSSVEDPLAMFREHRFTTPPLPATAPIRRAVSTIDVGRSVPHALIAPFRLGTPGSETGSPLRPFASIAPAGSIRRQHSSISLSQAASQGITPFRAKKARRASATHSASANASPRVSHLRHPFIDSSTAEDTNLVHPPVAIQSQVASLKAHLDAYVAQTVAQVKRQLEEFVQNEITRYQQQISPPAIGAGGAPLAPFIHAPDSARGKGSYDPFLSSPRPSKLTLPPAIVGAPALPPLSPFSGPSPRRSTLR